jgi:thioesterase domain-containing protein
MPLYAVPGHNGDVFCFRALAACMSAGRALFGLQPPGLDGRSRPMSRVEDVAGYFAAQITASRPASPVIIAAYCAGGAVALDITRQLRQSGQAVAMLVLIGTPFPTAYRKPRFAMIRAREHLHRLRGNWLRLLQLFNPTYVRDLLRSLRREAVTGEVNPELPSGQAALQLALQHATMDAACRYVPAAVDVPILQILPNRRWRHLGIGHQHWRRLTGEYHEFVAPDHVTQDTMLKQPHVQLIARVLEDQIISLPTGSRPTE